MENYQLAEAVSTFYLQVTSFPDGVTETFDKLQALLPSCEGRTFYGISKLANGVIDYKAAVQELYPGEGEELGCSLFMIPEGSYVTETIHDWKQHMDQFKQVFMRLLDTPHLDRASSCIEWYRGDDVLCMVKLA